MAVLTRAAAFALAIAGCLSVPSYDGTMYRCVKDPICPAGFSCVNGTCVTGSSDAMTGNGGVVVTVPAGSFDMGCNPPTPCPGDAQPRHTVTLGRFAIHAREVSEAEYRTCSSCTAIAGSDPDKPATQIGWTDADRYCKSIGMLLPTEAQWERAARTADDPYPWGTADPSGRANFNSSGVVGELALSPAGDTPSGLHHMAGNVREWAADFYQSDYYTMSPGTDPQGPASGSLRVVRGGGFTSMQVTDLDVWTRTSADPAHPTGTAVGVDIGFRCAVAMP